MIHESKYIHRLLAKVNFHKFDSLITEESPAMGGGHFTTSKCLTKCQRQTDKRDYRNNHNVLNQFDLLSYYVLH